MQIKHTTQVAISRRLGIITAGSAKKRDGPFLCVQSCACHLFLAKPSNKDGIRRIRPYFRRPLADANQNSCSNLNGGGGGESDRHIACKALLKETFGCYSFVIQKCPCCQSAVYFEQRPDWRAEVECTRAGMSYRYDVGLYDATGTLRFALEVTYPYLYPLF